MKFVLLFCLAFLYSCSSQDNKNPHQGPKATQVDYLLVQEEDRNTVFECSGSVSARESVEIKAEVSGLITRIAFSDGQFVSKGQLLFQLENRDILAEIDKIKAQIKLLNNTLNRYATLLEKQGISKQEFENAQADLEIKQAELRIQELKFEKTLVRAPFSGRIGLRTVSPGSYVGSTQTLTSIQDCSSYKIDFNIPEKWLSMARTGQNIYFLPPNSTDTLNATISALDAKLNDQNQTRLARAEVSGKYTLNPGSLVKIFIPSQSKKGIFIPSKSLIPDIRVKKVFVAQNGQAIQKEIILGERWGGDYQVLSGLTSGDTLLVSGLMQVKNKGNITLGKHLSPQQKASQP